MTGWTRWIVVPLLAVWLGAAAGGTFAAAGAPADEGEASSRYSLNPAVRKFGRGVGNFFGGWLEIPVNIHHYRTKEDTAGTFVSGAVMGVGRGLWRTAVGLYETLTFAIPVPFNYDPILPTLEYFDRETKRGHLPLEG